MKPGPPTVAVTAANVAIVNNQPEHGLLTICGDIRSVRDMPAAAPGGPKVGEAARARAFATIRQAILSGDLAPGRRLVEEDLADRSESPGSRCARHCSTSPRTG